MTHDRDRVYAQTLYSFFCFSLLALANCAFAETASIDDVEQVTNYKLRLKVETSASRETIWQLWEDVDNWQQYDELVIYSKLDEGHVFETGARGEVKAKGAPKSRFVLTEVIPGEAFTERLATPLWQSIDLHRYFETSETGNTIFVHEVEFKGRLRWLIYSVAGATFKKEMPRVMNKLREVAELNEAKLEQARLKNTEIKEKQISESESGKTEAQASQKRKAE